MAQAISTSCDSLALLSTILSCRSYADLGDRLLAPITEHLGASSSVFLQFLHLDVERSIGQHNYRGPEPGSVEAYVDWGLFSADPCVRPSLDNVQAAKPGSKLVHLSRIAGWRGSEYEAEFLIPFDFVDVIALAVPVRSALETSMMCVGFHRINDDQRFTSEQEARLRALTPALETVLTNIAYAESLTLSGTVFDAIATAGAGTGIVVLDDDLAVRHANRLGLQHLNLLGDDTQRSVVVRSEAFGNLRERLMFAIDRGVPAGQFTLQPSGVEVEVRSFEGPGGQICYLVVTFETGGAKRLARGCDQHGLSERESDVVRLLCAGQSNAAIALQLGIALRTVENHLRSIYAKVEVTSRTQLISKLALV